MTGSVRSTFLKRSMTRHQATTPQHPIKNLIRAMKNLLAAVFTLILASSVIIGCGFVDDNPADVQFQDEQVESTYIYGARIDTTGYEGP